MFLKALCCLLIFEVGVGQWIMFSLASQFAVLLTLKCIGSVDGFVKQVFLVRDCENYECGIVTQNWICVVCVNHFVRRINSIEIFN